ncbi:3-chlorobenzoate-3,4-dioxygenase reductase subunit [Lindgomyces ingoldianus]|uniref:3-chlorobenzoate-3,4-dioxygenase reductase subunit n=1 Tax=Lindgomyces ingoldianus TaxID=673940 RepID=A0ACB6R1X5_9PLEO|nr:3-chlorobenzoate-3,4-dioxygenase reductase subunit [Lindgomyces ingoldianus]KAF2472512.1 3-chlorobenzoate-3,4-dioxygenase reductase subunit [Lindgomyces ingoldianus]
MAINDIFSPPPLPCPDSLKSPPPFKPHPLRQLRTGRIQPAFNVPELTSAIYKVPLHGPQEITKSGIPTDEQAFIPHGTTDRALLHYSSSHYPLWKSELPQSAHLFNAGAFGENLVSDGLDEKAVCIGDKVSIEEVLLQVAELREPCYKLNHRFEVKDMAKRTQTLFRTGWLYRVLKTGLVAPGDTITLVERLHPEWTVARVQYYLYHERDNVERMREILEVKELSGAIKNVFRKRVGKGRQEDQDQRMLGDAGLAMNKWNGYRIAEKRKETSRGDANDDPIVEPGSHVRLKLGGKLVRAYSVIGGTTKRFEIGVALEAKSHGGSKFLHEEAKVGDVLTISRITPSFPLAKDAAKHIIIAGGIGITAFLAALRYLRESRLSYELHFAVAGEVPLERYIASSPEQVKIYSKSQGQGLDSSKIIARADPKTHIYCCGPQRLMDGVRDTSKEFDVPESSVHFETFAIMTGGDPFTTKLRESKKTVEVESSQTLLDALREVGMDINSSCEAGNCGTCRVSVCSGRVEHRGTGLLEREKQSVMLSCVSRSIGPIVLNL